MFFFFVFFFKLSYTFKIQEISHKNLNFQLSLEGEEKWEFWAHILTRSSLPGAEEQAVPWKGRQAAFSLWPLLWASRSCYHLALIGIWVDAFKQTLQDRTLHYLKITRQFWQSITSWQIEGERVEALKEILFSGATKLLRTVTVVMKLKDVCSLEGKLWQI